MEVTDEFGRVVRWPSGTHLVSESTEADGAKQWTEADVWRTAGGSYVMRMRVIFRILHIDENCRRFGSNHIPRKATPADWSPCPDCDPRRTGTGKFGVTERCSVDVAESAADFIHMMKDQNGVISNFRRYLLAEISEQDEAVRDLWMVVDVA